VLLLLLLFSAAATILSSLLLLEREKTEITERELRGAFSQIREIYSLARR
jgi:hypothetical protein